MQIESTSVSEKTFKSLKWPSSSKNNGSPVTTIVMGAKRAMAGEYCRELSAKVFAGQCRLIELGFR